jgi:hypothetical protein
MAISSIEFSKYTLDSENSELSVHAGNLPLEPLCLHHFVLEFFEIDSPEIFSWAGFESYSS